jgi:hypothetical protein
MNIYLISQDENTEYDTFSDAVVIAENAEMARQIHPEIDWGHEMSSNAIWAEYGDDIRGGSWCSSPEKVKVELVGQAMPGAVEGIILTSFHAG